MTEVATRGAAVPKPVHVPDSAVYDFDFYRDPAYLADPHRRILQLVQTAPPTQRNGGHWMFLSHSANFRAGPHRCLGSHLARVQLQTLYEQMLARLPEFRLDPDHAPIFHGDNVIGIDTLTLVGNP
jgi:cytochrome P450